MKSLALLNSLTARFLAAILVLGLVTGCDSPTEDGDDVSDVESPDPMEGLKVPGVSSGRSVDRHRNPTGNGIGVSVQVPVKANVDPDSLELPDVPHNYELAFLSWNVESEGADVDVIVEQLTAMNEQDRYDIVGLTEVLPADLGRDHRDALGEHYKYAFTKSGWNDRIQLLYNENKFEKLRDFEVKEINLKGRYRAPLVVHFKSKKNDLEFLVMINHLARGKEEIRQQQATMLVDWAREQTLPVVAIGDYNFDYVFETDKGNPAFNNFMRDNVWKWIRPEEMIDTNWYDNPREPDGKDDYPGSMLDFAFVAQGAKEWKSTCRVIVREHDFPDDDTTSDHRPFELLINR